MTSILDIIFYALIFSSVYVQVFFFVTFLENRRKIIVRNGKITLGYYPTVTIAVPCFNEEATVEKTVQSILSLNYPMDKVKILIVDDGSTDNSWNVVSKFSDYPNIKIFRKKNGGKYTALNLALAHTETDFFGGLDADSFADPESLVRIISYFQVDSSVMAVVPSVRVYNFKNSIQNAQKAEYQLGIFLKKMLGFLGAINVTPGPMTIFRKCVFDNLGPYRHGHNTEDMEIAFRMQKNLYKIEHCNDAYIYTNTPKTLRKLYQQRLRWIYGFINNTLDYRSILFRKKYGNFSILTLPMGLISIFSVCYLFSKIIYNLGIFLYSKILILKTVGWHFATSKIFYFDTFFLNMRSFVFLVIFTYLLVAWALVFGRKMVEGKWGVSLGMIYFFPIFSLSAPIWLFSAVYSTVLRRCPAWR
ncbi:MAG TPA: glycosyltransferase [Candidatus Paceibacterota bacterium]|nr:glycosyltransferase [Candidatus Paceibacterota bacterium]